MNAQACRNVIGTIRRFIPATLVRIVIAVSAAGGVVRLRSASVGPTAGCWDWDDSALWGEERGLDEWAQRVDPTWLARDIRYARVALAEVRGRVSRTPPDPLAWMPLETFLMFGGKVSKMLKPPEKSPPPKKPPLREAQGGAHSPRKAAS